MNLPSSRSSSDDDAEREPLSLNDAAAHLLDECRMVLPGLQALFGFQLIAVFNSGFSTRLSIVQQRMHLVAIVLVVVAIALVMAPAALHRRTEPDAVSRRFLTVSTRLLEWGMAPLGVAICLDVYLVAALIAPSSSWAAVTAGFLAAVFVFLWHVLPASQRLQRRLGTLSTRAAREHH